jgi:predicted AAA+ superfamily ATPase
VFEQIKKYFNDDLVIVLHGARQVGKTYILLYIQQHLKQQNKKVFYFDLEYPDVLAETNKGVSHFIQMLKAQGYVEHEEICVLVDEVQYLDNPSSFIKIIADHYKNIHLIVSGSSSFNIKNKFKDSLVGRTVNFEIFNLSFEEFLEFKEERIVTSEVKTEKDISDLTNLYREFIMYGGYPRVVLEHEEEKKKTILLQTIDTYIRKDIKDLGRIEDVKKFNNMLYVLASQSSNLLNMASLSKEANISFPTLQKYLSILEETYVIKLVSPYSKSPSVEISKNPKVFFYDSGLASLLWFNNFQKTLLGSVFETNVFGELVKHYGRFSIHFWRTKHKQEIDFVVETEKQLLPIEVKVSFNQFSSSAIRSFLKKYHRTEWRVVALDGERKDKHYIFPWQIS